VGGLRSSVGGWGIFRDLRLLYRSHCWDQKVEQRRFYGKRGWQCMGTRSFARSIRFGLFWPGLLYRKSQQVESPCYRRP